MTVFTDTILQEARELVERERASASSHRKAAFVNALLYLVTGDTGIQGGPSVRELAVRKLFPPQGMTMAQAAAILLEENGLIFGPVLNIHREAWAEKPTFDDDPVDVRVLTAEDHATLDHP